MEDLKGHPYYITEKIDGTSCTITKLNGEFTVAARTYAIKEANNYYWNAVNHFKLREKLPDGFALQGEVCGPGIQKNRTEYPFVTIRIFNVFDIKKGIFLDWDDACKFCADIGVRTVDELYRDDNFNWGLPNLLEFAKGNYPGTNIRREGIVVRPLKQMRSEALGGSRLSFKVLNNDFLLKDEE
jgi:RNA ligase (TIGR02306 family)